MVLITGHQDRGAVEEAVDERLRHPGHVDIVDIDKIKLMRPATTGFMDHITQTRVTHHTGVLVRALLITEGRIDLDVRGEEQTCFCLSFNSPTAIRGTPFVRSTGTDGEHLRTAEDVLVAVVDTRSYTPIAGTVRTLRLDGHRVLTTLGDRDRAVE